MLRFSLQVDLIYQGRSATHGWDIGSNYTNMEPLGCKMTKCNVTVTYDAETTQAVKSKLVEIVLK